MVFSFNIAVNDPLIAFRNAQEQIEKTGGKLKGDDMSGKFSGLGVKGKYNVHGNGKVAITITEKPFFASEELIKSKVKEFFVS